MVRLIVTAGVCAVLFSSCARPTVSDADGNVYHTVKIGSQVWTVENLRTTKLNDGTPIAHVPGDDDWHRLSSPGYCYFGNTNSADSISKFGALYNWYCVGSGKLAPQGWHVPTNDDWDTLQNYLISHGHNWDGTKSENRIAKSLAAKSDWLPFEIEGMPGNNPKDNNRSGFTGFGTGYRQDSQDSIPGSTRWKAAFTAIGHKAGWWSATPVNQTVATIYALGFCVDDLMRYQSFDKTCGYSVRLVKDRE